MGVNGGITSQPGLVCMVYLFGLSLTPGIPSDNVVL